MTAHEFYQTMKEWAKNEMMTQGRQAVEETDALRSQFRQGQSEEAAKFYRMIEMTWLDNSEQKI